MVFSHNNPAGSKNDILHPSPQEHEASIQNEEPPCFTEDQIYDIQPEVLQE
jgi:hypothetical protein